MNLSKEQQKAALTESKKALVLAGAGSGKSRTLVGRVEYLIKEKGVSPYEIMCITFTRLAAKELVERLEKVIGGAAYNITTGTIHGMALNYLQRFGELAGLIPGKITIYSQWESDFLLKDVAKELGYHTGRAWKKVKKYEVDAGFNLFYTTGEINPESIEVNLLMTSFLDRCRENNALTYGTILTTFKGLITEISQYLNLRHIMIDEVQDNDPLQWEIVNLLCRYTGAHLFAVGDIRQCQPAGTMVLTTNGYVDIEHIKPNIHELKVYDRHDAMIFGGHNRGYGFEKSARIFSGTLYDVSTKKFNTKCTGNHKWLVKWNNEKRSLDWNVVYLMRRGDRFRIGWCQLFNGNKQGNNIFHLGQRMNIEKADSAWVLKIFDNKKEASLWESILAANYGIPLIMFEPTEQTHYYDEAGIDLVFYNVKNLDIKSERLLSDLGLDINYPFHSKQKNHQKKGGARIFEIETINMAIMPDRMYRVPQQRETGRYLDWEPISITSEVVRNITVYSLDVEKYHTYIADGLCTKNSIFSFRGADPEYILRNQHLFDLYNLKDNYRSSATIVDAANKIISHNLLDLGEPMEAKRVVSIKIENIENMDSDRIVGFCASYQNHDCAILSRVHGLLKKLSILLDEAGVKHEYIGKKTGLVKSEEFRRFHAFLKLIVNPFDNFSFLLIRDFMAITMREYGDIRLKASQESKSHYQIWLDMSDTEDHFSEWLKASEPTDFHTVVDLLKDVSWNFDPEPIFEFVYLWLLENPAGTIDQYLNWLACFDVQDELTTESCGLKLMTIHAAKGLEFSTVIIAGLNEGIFPDKRSVKENDLTSELRLAYVALTRAEDQLILTSRPIKKDKSGNTSGEPSRFIEWSLK